MAALTLENLRRDTQMRVETDKIISPLWVLLPLIGLVITVIITLVLVFAVIGAAARYPAQVPQYGALVALFGVIAVLGILGIAMLVAYLYLVYSLIKRRNRHFERQWRFVEDMSLLIRAVASRMAVDVEMPLSSVDRTLRDMMADEREKSAILWVVLTLIPYVNLIASLYVLYFLTKDFYRHERREDSMTEDLKTALGNLGLHLTFRRSNPIPERNFVLYVILSIVTLGIFGVYWLYVLIVDPNNHFRSHVQYEDEALTVLSVAV